MRRFRVSIAGLMAFVVCVAVLLASVHEATDLWARGMLTLAVGASGVSLLGALFCRGGRRAAWTGFLVFEAGYLVLCVAPGFDTRVMPRLASTALIDEQYLTMYCFPKVGERVWFEQGIDQIESDFVEGRVFGSRTDTDEFDVALRNGTIRCGAVSLRALSRSAFRQLCHADLSLLLGFVGALVARFFAARSETEMAREDRPAA